MIFGIGCDIANVSRFAKWVENEQMIKRFFNKKELKNAGGKLYLQQHYASRFATKEAFSKALGVGIFNFDLKDVYVMNDENGKPKLFIEGNALKILEEKCGNSTKLFLSISHEKEFAIAFVVIEL